MQGNADIPKHNEVDHNEAKAVDEHNETNIEN
jgi:hypothetical protein